VIRAEAALEWLLQGGIPRRAVHGWPRMTKELCARGRRVGKERGRRLMQQHGIRAWGRRKFVVTTDSTRERRRDELVCELWT
jgi:hypothetical protein